MLSYAVEAHIGGKLAQLGQRLVNGVAKKLADEFFQKFSAAVAPQSSSVSTQPAPELSRWRSFLTAIRQAWIQWYHLQFKRE